LSLSLLSERSWEKHRDLGIKQQLNHNSHVHSKTKLLLSALTLIILCSVSTSAQTAEERHQRIVSAIDSGDRNTAIQELRTLRSTNKELFATRNYDYLLARLSEDAGDLAESQSNYQSVVDRKSLLAAYALWHLAQRARASGDLVLERERLRQFLVMNASDELRSAALLRLGESFMESGDYPAVISVVASLTTYPNLQISRKAQVLSAHALQRDKKTTEAREVFSRILMKMPDASRPDDFALEAVEALDAMDENSEISESEHLLRASVYQFNRHFDDARTHYMRVAEANPQGPTAPNALYQVGRGLYQQQNFEKAIEFFRRVFTQFPEVDSAREALGFTASSYNRMKRTEDAVSAYKQLIERYPNSPNPERPYLNVIDVLHETGRYREALNWAAQTRVRFNGQLAEALALFAQLRIHLAQGQWAAVVTDAEELKKLPDLGGGRVPGGTTVGEVLFLQALALEQLGRTNEALEDYLSIPDGRNEYYGQLATNRLRTLANGSSSKTLIQTRANTLIDQARQASQNGQHEIARHLAQRALPLAEGSQREELLRLLRSAYQTLPAYTFPNLQEVPFSQLPGSTNSSASELSQREIAEALGLLHVYDEAVPIFAALNTRNRTTPTQQTQNTPTDAEYTLAILALRGGLANIAVRFGERLWRGIAADYFLEIAPREYVDLLYPAPYRQLALKHASERGVDPRFVLSIARQESRFQADAKSLAAARGMMQFIPETANQVAQELGRKEFQQDELYSADAALLFGSQYLATLFRQFPGQPEAVAAAYNGGADNMARWMARSHSRSPERYVPEIGFAQTKDYVFRVMTNYRAYQRLYDARLQRQ
jgi:soluble lytic murein transglycosylase